MCFPHALQGYAMQGAGLRREQVQVCCRDLWCSPHSSLTLAGGLCDLSLLISLCALRTFIFLKVKSK